jgi:mono/diheme cytochrome c family protein
MRISIRTIVIVVLLTVMALGVFLYTGIYNVSATEQHTGLVYQLLDFTMQRSVQRRADAITIPDLTGQQRLQRGLVHYRNHCVQCHGAPGVAPDAFSMGMMPVPANLVATGREWEAPRIFWVVKHGIRMSGMPAWQYRMNDEEIWDVVAFVKHLTTLTPAGYAALNKNLPDRPAGPDAPSAAVPVIDASSGNPQAGAKALQQYMCVTCHQIPGIVGASRHVGPPLNGIATRTYIAGVLPNSPANLIHWIRNPTSVDPLSAMPDLGVSEKDARDMAAYLYTLKDVE